MFIFLYIYNRDMFMNYIFCEYCVLFVSSFLLVGSVNEIELLNRYGFDKHRFVSKEFLYRNELIGTTNTIDSTSTKQSSIVKKKEKAIGMADKKSNIVKKKFANAKKKSKLK